MPATRIALPRGADVCWDDSAPESITVVLADDHEIVRNGIRMSMPGTPSLEILPRIAAAYMNPEIAERLVASHGRPPPLRLSAAERRFLSIRSDYLGGRAASADACGAAPPWVARPPEDPTDKSEETRPCRSQPAGCGERTFTIAGWEDLDRCAYCACAPAAPPGWCGLEFT